MKKITLLALVICTTTFAYAQQRTIKAQTTTKTIATITNPATPNTFMLACDTLTNVNDSDQLALYTVEAPNSGYVSGHNSYGDKAKADFFTYNNPLGAGVCDKAFLFFGKAETLSQTAFVTVKIWAANAAGKPAAVLASQQVLIADIATDVAAQNPTFVQFLTPANITGDYFVGYEMTYAAGDIVALYSNVDSASLPGTAWELFSDDTWHAFSEAASWGLDLSLAVIPIVCSPGVGTTDMNENFVIYPNPSTNGVFRFNEVNNQPITGNITVYDAQGKQIQVVNLTNATTQTIDLSTQPRGIYTAKLVNNNGSVAVHKLVLSK
jgi:hypothetical protein